ncbi:hypothetical protein SAMN06265367_106289 [Algoriphagus winogradskyi]|uniref:Uncharacterized protein n=2 Tax=Algoriphagus winogradskyi TaxID=237017 RepID=A0ABY1PDB2_9BACT|nr:hypothetical protein SAMN06265367_106289 [Algoriphagus winogradskyi]
MSGLILSASLFAVQPVFAVEQTGEFEKEYCAISSGLKCKQTGTSCDGKQVCFWKDLKDVAIVVGSIVGTVAAIDKLAE